MRRTKNAARVTPNLPFFGNPLQTPQNNIAFSPSVPLSQFSISQQGDEFKPFIPEYFRPNNYQTFSLQHGPRVNDMDKSPSQVFYKSLSEFPIPESYKFRPSLERPLLNNHGINSIEAAHSHVVPERRLPKDFSTEHQREITQAITRAYENVPSKEHNTTPGTEATTVTTKNFERLPSNQHNVTVDADESKEIIEDQDNNNNNVTSTEEETSSSYEEEMEHYEPPPEFFRTENKYENVHNPFADPYFDFDKFLDGFTTSTTTTTTTTTPKPQIKVIHYYQPLPSILHMNKQLSQIPRTALLDAKETLGVKTVSSNGTTVGGSLVPNYEVRDNEQEVLDSPVNPISSENFPVVATVQQIQSNIKKKNEYVTTLRSDPNSKAVVNEYFESSSKPNPTTPSNKKNTGANSKRQLATNKKPVATSSDYYYEYDDGVPQNTKNSTTYVKTGNVKNPSEEYEYYYDDEYDYAISPKTQNGTKTITQRPSSSVTTQKISTLPTRKTVKGTKSAQVDVIQSSTEKNRGIVKHTDLQKSQSVLNKYHSSTAQPAPRTSSSTKVSTPQQQNAVTTERQIRDYKRRLSKFSKR